MQSIIFILHASNCLIILLIHIQKKDKHKEEGPKSSFKFNFSDDSYFVWKENFQKNTTNISFEIESFNNRVIYPSGHLDTNPNSILITNTNNKSNKVHSNKNISNVLTPIEGNNIINTYNYYIPYITFLLRNNERS